MTRVSAWTPFLLVLVVVTTLLHSDGVQGAPHPEALYFLRGVASRIPGLTSLSPVPWSATTSMSCATPWTGVRCVNSNSQIEVDISNRGLSGLLGGMIDGVPVGHYFPRSLTRWNSSGNALTGWIPEPYEESAAYATVSIDVSYNLHTGLSPAQFGWNMQLQTYIASYNPLGYNVAQSRFHLYRRAEVIRCRNCTLYGPWPASLWQTTIPSRPYLRIVDFADNAISGHFWAGSDPESPLMEYYAQGNRLTSAKLPYMEGKSSILDLSRNPGLWQLEPFLYPFVAGTFRLNDCALNGTLAMSTYLREMDRLEVSRNRLVQIQLPATTRILYAASNLLTTMEGTTLDSLRIYRVESNNIAVCTSFTTTLQMLDCSLANNPANFGTCTLPVGCTW